MSIRVLPFFMQRNFLFCALVGVFLNTSCPTFAGTFSTFLRVSDSHSREIKNAISSAFNFTHDSQEAPIYTGLNLIKKDSYEYNEAKSVYDVVIALREARKNNPDLISRRLAESLPSEQQQIAKNLLTDLENYFLNTDNINDTFRSNTVVPLLQSLLTKTEWDRLIAQLPPPKRTRGRPSGSGFMSEPGEQPGGHPAPKND